MGENDTNAQIPLFEIPMTIKDEPAKASGKASTRDKSKLSDSSVKQARPARDSSADAKPQLKGTRQIKARQKEKIKVPLSGQVPEGDVRLTANIRDDLHLKLKIAAARRRTTIGELIEELVEKHL